jgi:AraC-like DNA-binding protein
MARENIYQSLEIFYEKVDHCPLRERMFNFFEMVYVISGSGMHAVNGNRFAFFSEDLFLITPSDTHEFDLVSTCEFMVIRFGQNYINEYQWKSIDHLECILHYASDLSGSVLINEDDKEIVGQLIQNLRLANSDSRMYAQDLIRHLVNAIIVIAARNIALLKPSGLSTNPDNRITQILDYIQEHIRQPDLLRINVIADRFGMSPTYLGSYFRRQCADSLQQYISSYRIRLIEHRLRFSGKRIHEIADEFGFADESHINKFFKRHKQMSLGTYRNDLGSPTKSL